MNKLFVIFLAVAAFAALPIPGNASSPPTANSYDYLAGAGSEGIPLCAFGGCPAVARSSSGATIEIEGTGTFMLKPAQVTGGGEYTWRNPAGQVVETGTWTALQLLSFQSFGLGVVIGGRQLEGGVAKMQIVLSSGRGAALRITCDEGDEPPSAQEGIRVAIVDGPNFNTEVSGLTAFPIRSS
jgi:hypothetical protein